MSGAASDCLLTIIAVSPDRGISLFGLEAATFPAKYLCTNHAMPPLSFVQNR
jgi:hypothetical protein